MLGASNLTYVEPVFSEDVATWVGCHVRAFEYFGGVTQLVVPDNLKAGVTQAHRYEPDLNPTYSDLARHYGLAILPARPRKPRDKAKVEAAVLLAERWILAALRHRRFARLSEVHEAVKPLLEKLNARPMRKLGKSRRELFEQVERAALKPLPARPYQLAFWKKARVNIDYHVELEGHCYSVPYMLVGKAVEVRHTEACVEVFLGGRRVASHMRSAERGRFTTLPEHMPASHRQHAEWTPSRLIRWAEGVGPSCARLVEELMTRRPHPQQGFRSALGVLRLADEKKYGKPRVEKACARALRHRAVSYKSVAAILQHRLEDVDETAADKGPLPEHQNVRGAHYYH
ncbi:IS21 family transposase [Myxococcaceae bacterium GXIMD 01537]